MSRERRRENPGSEMIECQVFETDLNRRTDLTGKRARISIRRSQLLAMASAF